MTKTLLAAALSIALAPAAWAQDAAPTSSTPSATTLDAVSVIGSGEARQVQRITRENLDILPPGTSLQKTSNLLPGVNAQSADALGTNEQSMTLSLRGFNSTRLGYTLDGVPLGDGAYNNYNGLTINRALISENMAGAELAVGIGSLGTPSTSNLGGTISYTSDRPAQELGGRVVQTFGSDANRRTFVRVDSGEYNGFSGYVSGMNAVSDLWNDQTAYNKSTTKQFNAKGVWNLAAARSPVSSILRAPPRPTTSTCPRTRCRAAWAGTGRLRAGLEQGGGQGLLQYRQLQREEVRQQRPGQGRRWCLHRRQILRDDNLYYLAGDFFLADGFSSARPGLPPR
jgi:iron complex outermembrane receptor protein